MISEFKYPNRDWQLYVSKVDLDYYLKFIEKFENITRPIEKKKAFWHNTISEYVLKEIENNKIRIEFSDEIVTIMFDTKSNDESKQFLKNIVQTIDSELNNEAA